MKSAARTQLGRKNYKTSKTIFFIFFFFVRGTDLANSPSTALPPIFFLHPPPIVLQNDVLHCGMVPCYR